MKTQISRDSLQSGKRYTGVYQQQGRMITDADWNELSDLAKQRLLEALQDAVKSGAPRDGGLRVNSDKTLQPGALYVDGFHARLPGSAAIAYPAQPDYPNPPALPANRCHIYADLWERSVSSLEDAALVDPGLHGADTSTRTQAMLQVKWCPDTIDPESNADNPAMGDAGIKLKLRRILSTADACDPCSAELDLDEHVGNYLFRVEVHNVFRQGGSDFLALKWSRDNGAEQYAVGGEPSDFKQGDWVYEFFDNATEKNLGVHLATGANPVRGELVDGYAVPAAPKPRVYVRQWDGSCVINLSALALVSGKDKGVALSASYGFSAHGKLQIKDTDPATGQFSLHINLDLLEMQLQLTGKTFVAGDYWQAAVREAEDHSGDYVLGAAGVFAAPAGVLHRYLRLATVNSSGVVVALTDAESRRFNFPPLTDIKAADVGFTEGCHTLFNGAENVQEALDALCTLAADDIAYAVPGCAPSVASLMAATAPWPDVDSDGKTTVKDMLDALMCRLDAARLPYDGSAVSAFWTSLKSETAGTAPNTVQQAIDDLLRFRDSKDIVHSVTGCGTAAAPSVRSLLALSAAPTSTANILDALLCNLNAGHIPLAKTLSCDPNAAKALTVQDALEVLCGQEGGSCCSVTVGAGGDKADIKTALSDFMATGAPQDMLLCLLPGSHVLEADIEVTGKRSIKITGAGITATTVQFQGAQLRFQAQEIHLEDFALTLTQGSGRLVLEAPNVSVEDCDFRRTGTSAATTALITAQAPTAGGSVFFEHNSIVSSWQSFKTAATAGTFAPESMVGAKVAGLFGRIFTDESLANPASIEIMVKETAEEIIKLPQTTRATWAGAVPASMRTGSSGSAGGGRSLFTTDGGSATMGGSTPVSRSSVGSESSFAVGSDSVSGTRGINFARLNPEVAAMASGTAFFAGIGKADLEVAEVEENLIDLILASVETGYSPALMLSSHKVGGSLAFNSILGAIVVLNNGSTTGMDLGEQGVVQVVGPPSGGSIDPVDAVGARLDLSHNQLVRFTVLAPSSAFDRDDIGRLASGVEGFESLNLSHNVFEEDQSALVGGVVNLQNNRFKKGGTASRAALVLADQLLATGNSAAKDVALRHHSTENSMAANLWSMGTI